MPVGQEVPKCLRWLVKLARDSALLLRQTGRAFQADGPA